MIVAIVGVAASDRWFLRPSTDPYNRGFSSESLPRSISHHLIVVTLETKPSMKTDAVLSHGQAADPTANSVAVGDVDRLPTEPMDPALTSIQPGGGVIFWLELAWGRLRRWYLKN